MTTGAGPEKLLRLHQARDLTAQYLATYPADAIRLLPLRERLEIGDEDVGSRKSSSGHLTASALVLAPDGTCLTIHHAGLGMWLPPGGHWEVGETLLQAATRELQEETAYSSLPLNSWHARHPHPFDIDIHWIPEAPTVGEVGHWHFDAMFLFDRGSFPASLEPAAGQTSIWVDLALVRNLSLRWLRVVNRIGQR